jgi:hypothetical protein
MLRKLNRECTHGEMIGDLKLCGLIDNTLETYLHCVSVFARHHGMSPARGESRERR